MRTPTPRPSQAPGSAGWLGSSLRLRWVESGHWACFRRTPLQPGKYRIIRPHRCDLLVFETKRVDSVAAALCRYGQPPTGTLLLQLCLVVWKQADALQPLDCRCASVTHSEGADRACRIRLRKSEKPVVYRYPRRKVWATATERMPRDPSSNYCHYQDYNGR